MPSETPLESALGDFVDDALDLVVAVSRLPPTPALLLAVTWARAAVRAARLLLEDESAGQ